MFRPRISSKLDNIGEQNAGGSGTVTSVGLSLPNIFNVSGSPVTTSGTLTAALANQNANTVFAGPSTGAAATPTFRSLVANDVPDLSSTYVTLANPQTISGVKTFSNNPIFNATQGSIFFAGTGGVISQNNSMLFWDNINNIFYAGANSGAFTNSKAHFQSTVNSYSQINSVNKSAGTSASTDFIATSDNGTDTTNYIDFGINSSTYNDAAFTSMVALDGYLYTNGGNLIYGTQSNNKGVGLITGGTLLANIRQYTDETGRFVWNNQKSVDDRFLYDFRGTSTQNAIYNILGAGTTNNSNVITCTANATLRVGDTVKGTLTTGTIAGMTFTSGTNTFTCTSNAQIGVGCVVSGTGINVGTKITSITGTNGAVTGGTFSGNTTTNSSGTYTASYALPSILVVQTVNTPGAVTSFTVNRTLAATLNNSTSNITGSAVSGFNYQPSITGQSGANLAGFVFQPVITGTGAAKDVVGFQYSPRLIGSNSGDNLIAFDLKGASFEGTFRTKTILSLPIQSSSTDRIVLYRTNLGNGFDFQLNIFTAAQNNTFINAPFSSVFTSYTGYNNFIHTNAQLSLTSANNNIGIYGLIQLSSGSNNIGLLGGNNITSGTGNIFLGRSPSTNVSNSIGIGTLSSFIGNSLTYAIGFNDLSFGVADITLPTKSFLLGGFNSCNDYYLGGYTSTSQIYQTYYQYPLTVNFGRLNSTITANISSVLFSAIGQNTIGVALNTLLLHNGDLITGTGIPASTTVVNFNVGGVIAGISWTGTNQTLITAASTANLAINQSFSGTGIPANTYITAINSPTTFTISGTGTTNASPSGSYVVGVWITISNNTTTASPSGTYSLTAQNVSGQLRSTTFNSAQATGNAISGDFIFRTSVAGASGSTPQSYEDVLRITGRQRVSIGNLGINNTLAKFHVKGSTNTGVIGTADDNALRVDGATINNIFNVLNNGSVVINGTGITSTDTKLDVNGSIGYSIRTVTTSTTALNTDIIILVDASSGPVTITIPVVARRGYWVKKIDASANDVTVVGSSGLVDGAANKAWNTQNTAFIFQCDGTNYQVF